MFTILQKSNDSVTAEDLETLQNSLEKYLVDIVTESWDLELEFEALSTNSPDLTSSSGSNQINSTSSKLRNSLRSNHIDPPDTTSDGFKNGNSTNAASASSATTVLASNSAEESLGSEDSCTRSINTDTNISDTGSQIPNTQNSAASSKKRSLKDNPNDHPSKRFRQNSSNSVSSPLPQNPKRISQSKRRSKIVPSKYRDPTDEARLNKKQALKNEAPDKLWPFVEQFCVAPSEEQIEELEEMAKSLENDKEYFKIPPLGKKDSVGKDSSFKIDNVTNSNDGITATNSSSTVTNSTGTTNSRKKTKSKGAPEKSDPDGFGALTQRCVSIVIEPSDETSNGGKADDGFPQKKKTNSASSNNNNNNNSNNTKSRSAKKNIDMNKAKKLEETIREGLEEHDILSQQDELPYGSEDDEILRELIASQHELLSIQNQNKEFIRRLLKRAKNHSNLESEREKLREANAHVMASYHKLIQARQRKRNPTNKEKDIAWKSVKAQEAIFRRCDELYLAGLSKDD